MHHGTALKLTNGNSGREVIAGITTFFTMAYIVIVKQIKTVAVSAPLNAMPVPGVERIAGFTTTM